MRAVAVGAKAKVTIPTKHTQMKVFRIIVPFEPTIEMCPSKGIYFVSSYSSVNVVESKKLEILLPTTTTSNSPTIGF